MITPMKAFVNHFYRKAGLINDEKPHFCRFTPTEIFMTLLTFTVFCAALFLNGATDAANAVTGAISSKAMSARSAVCLAALLEGVGLAAAYIFLPAVSNTVSSLCDLGRTTTQSSAVICTVCLSSVALWAALAWAAGLPTSESHGLMASMCGCGAALGAKINVTAAAAVIAGLAASVIVSAALAYTSAYLMSPIKTKNRLLKRMCIAFLSLSALMHGAQDGQKFLALLSWAGIITGSPVSPIVCAVLMGAGTLCGGGRIVKKMGGDMTHTDLYTSCVSDLGSSVTLLALTAAGVPVSTTHTKMSALAAAAKKNGKLDKKVLISLIAAWITTFPFCYFVSFLLMKMIKIQCFC